MATFRWRTWQGTAVRQCVGAGSEPAFLCYGAAFSRGGFGTRPYYERTSVERSNSVEDSYNLDHAHRNATFGQIRLCFVNICKHAKVRWLEATKKRTRKELFQGALDWLLQGDFEAPLPT